MDRGNVERKIPASMKAAVLVENRRVELKSVAIPEIQQDECLVHIAAAGVCSSDVARTQGGGAYFYPLIPGHEMAGTVVTCGSEVADRFAAGDRVTIFPLLPCFRCDCCAQHEFARCRSYGYYGSRRDGGFAEYLAVKAWNLLRVPDVVAMVDAALCEPAAVIIHALDRLTLDGDHEMVILGAGFLGLMAAQLTRRLHPRVRVVLADRNAYKLEVAATLGVETVLLPDPVAWSAYVEGNQNRFSRVLEAAGVPDSFRNAVELASPGGRVVWMGNISDDLSLPKSLVSSILRKEIEIVGTWNSSYVGDQPSDWTKAIDLMAQGWRPSALVNRTGGLDELPGILEALANHKSRRQENRILKAQILP